VNLAHYFPLRYTSSPTVLKALETDTSDIREAALAKVYAYRSGAAERAARIIEEWV
jgi:hypothetical protein